MLTGSLSAYASDRAAGLILGESGFGLNYSGRTPVSFRDSDQLQWRIQFSQADFGNDSRYDFEGNSYTGDVDLSAQRVGADWFPFARSQFFVSGGLGHFDMKVDVEVSGGDSYSVGGGERITDGSTLETHIDQSGFGPFVGLGWGNRLGERDGLSFMAELGVLKPLSSADVNVLSTSSGVAQSALDAEKRDIEDVLDGVHAYGSIGVTYRF